MALLEKKLIGGGKGSLVVATDWRGKAASGVMIFDGQASQMKTSLSYFEQPRCIGSSPCRQDIEYEPHGGSSGGCKAEIRRGYKVE